MKIPSRRRRALPALFNLKARPTRLTGLHVILSSRLIFTATAERQAKEALFCIAKEAQDFFFFPSSEIIDTEYDNNQ